ncbi:hypothetical protein PILCRDRAFT_85118 [Piloderma croceum F 1598]|uniref:Zinc/iron permease n=1 Tax=Piloderma croceum (strain F 1598) TaxID=765440 RepID=A0A0C3BSL5_PILCF|nr:hypothetical protein PILCRDRAFT_85118 [Piloderma croceum F 1598]
MSGFLTVLLMSFLLGIGSFSVGMLPLSFVFSKSHLAKLSTFGTGLLLGAALGVIIPEGIESISKHHPTALPTSKIAFSLLTGFVAMLLIEQFTSHAPSLPPISLNSSRSPDVHFDVDLGELERQEGLGHAGSIRASEASTRMPDGETRRSEKAYPLTVGLVMHGLADGLALGVSALGNTETDLSLVVFFALIIHKAPTALALTTSLLSTALPRSECKKHIAFFSASTPFGALVSYGLFSFLEAGGEGDWTGTALLISGGTFLYVATVLQPVSQTSQTHSAPSEDIEIGKFMRTSLIVTGMFLPFIIGALIGHGHGAAEAVPGSS